MTDPQTPEQVITVAALKHGSTTFNRRGVLHIGCICGWFGSPLEVGGDIYTAEHAAHQASEIVAALGLREERGEYRVVATGALAAKVVREVTPWRPILKEEVPADGD